jgi:hypothetical protein
VERNWKRNGCAQVRANSLLSSFLRLILKQWLFDWLISTRTAHIWQTFKGRLHRTGILLGILSR